jgi:hypothetical protein
MQSEETLIRGWLTTKQASEMLNVSVRHFWRLADELNFERQMLNPRSSLWNASQIRKVAKQRGVENGS